MQKIRWFFLIVGIVLALAMALQNNDPAAVQLLWLERSLPLSVLLLSATAIGFLLGALMTASMLRSRSKAAAEKKAAREEKQTTAKKSAPTSEPTPKSAEIS